MKQLKEIIKKNIIKFLPNAVKNELSKKPKWANISYSQEGEDLILERFFEGKEIGFFVDIGAHHPMRFSNTYIFYLKGWRGINVDATPGSMIPFEEKRPDDINLEIGVTKEIGELEYYIFDEPALNTFNKERADYLVKETNFKLKQEKKIKTQPLSKILNEYLPINKKIDFLTIDVEGLDLEILQSNDWEKYKPEIILCEDLNGSLENIESSKLYQLLHSHNYTLVARSYNTMFFKLI